MVPLLAKRRKKSQYTKRRNIMVRFYRILQLVVCIAMVTVVTACAATQKHESTGQYVDDSVITTKVKAAIFKEESLKTLQINVKTYKAVVQLSGFVDSAKSVSLAADVAKRVEGVGSVENGLAVK
jgi:osmotically-inducible protein OsmY